VRIGETLSVEDIINLSQYLEPLKSYCRGRMFLGAKNFLLALVQYGKATIDQYNAIKGLFSEQNIDLDSYGEN
jgi:hypothetical protein